MSTRQQIIVNALRQRYDEVCKSASQLAPGAIGKTEQLTPWTAPKTWFKSFSDSLTAIRALAANEQVECIEAMPPDEPNFYSDLQGAIREPQRRFELLTVRYVHPLNIAAPSETGIREHLLERLMVADRSRIEQHSLEQLNADDLLLRLNLIAIYASFTTDLRFLDALNYYYELLPSNWSTQNWLRLSFLKFYLRALAVHSN